MSEEQNRFSLRKLSVGLASVLIGVSIFGTSQTVKADTVANNQTSSVTSNAQSNDTQKNENVAKSSFSNDNQANNAKSNLIQTQDKAKNDQKQDSVPKTQEVNDSSNLDAEKDIVRTSSLQKSDNQSNNHAEDNSQTQTSQKLDLTKNSKKFAKKVLATNLTQDNSTQISNGYIPTQNDPSKFSTDQFADGTHWTVAGWTRTNKNTKIAKSSKLVIADNVDGHNETHPWRDAVTNPFNYYLQDLTFTINKDDMKSGNKILVATVQNLPINTKQKLDHSQASLWADGFNFDVSYQNQTVGNITIKQLDCDESDLYFTPTVTLNLASDPTFNYHFVHTGIQLNVESRSDYAKYHKDFPLKYYVATNNNVREYDTFVNPTFVSPLSKKSTTSPYNFYNAWAGVSIKNSQHQISGDGDANADSDYVVKIQSLDGTKFDIEKTRINITASVSIIDAKGNPTNESYSFYDKDSVSTKKTSNYLSSADLWNITPIGQAYYSIQKDGSVLLCVKQRPNTDIKKIDKNQLKSWAENSYLANIQDPDHRQQIIDNTINMTQGWSTYISSFKLPKYGLYQVDDVTPATNTNHTNFGTITMNYVDGSAHGNGNATDLETYKHVKISYVDDDDNSKSVSSDTMTGRQNKASTYTVNIPKGYYLDDNNTSTGYTWNADHTAISYTFNEDQAKNDANPIEIHLKHKHTAITDLSQLQTTGKRTITITLPHQDKPMIIVQTVGYKRTGDLDEATNTQTYTDWVFDADTSNVTVNGQISTQYQAYILKDGVVNYAPIKLPHINGYEAHLMRNKINPVMLMVSFVAVPSENKPSLPNEETPSKPSAPADNPNKPAGDLQQRVVTELNNNDSGWTMPETSSTYTVEVPADDAIIDLSDLVIAEPVHAQTRAKITVTKCFKLSKKHSIKHLSHRKKAVKSFKKYRL